MATFPGGIYSPTNTTPSSPRNNPSLSGEVNGANGEIVAVETFLGTNGSNIVTSLTAGTGASVNQSTGAITVVGTAADLTASSANLATSVSLPATSLTKVQDTASLSVGTWFIVWTMTVQNFNSGACAFEATIAQDSATATFSGNQSVGFVISGESFESSATLTTIATITASGTIKLSCYNTSATTASTVLAVTQVEGYANATGYTAFRLF